ncbi:MAG TPA: copper resistance protein CopC [Candidatus Binatia bacterium]|jgi:copper transport protein|nr:copper resistance protein CopC [Candidatus Binatia bacterium]
MRFRRIAAALAVVAGLFGLPGFASAHATPVTYEPAASSVAATAPAQVRIDFSERVEPAASSIVIYAPDGSRADAGDAAPEPGDARVLAVGVRDAGRGTYTASWQVVSADDGHFTKGAFTFSVGEETAPAAAAAQGFQISHSSSVPEAVTIWLELLGHAALMALLVLLAVWRPLRARHGLGKLDARFQRRADALAAVSALLGVLGAGGGIALKAFELSSAQSTAYAVALPRYLSTTAGSYAAVQAGAMLAAGVIWFAARKKLYGPRQGWPDAAVACLLLIDAFARTRVSHAAASHLLPRLSVAVQFLHLVSKDLWIGGGIVMAAVVVPALAGSTGALKDAARSWARIAAVAIGAAGVTGAYVVWLHLKDPANIFTTDWGGRFMLLGLAGAMLFAVRFVQMLLFESRLGERAARLAHRQLLGVEAVIGACMLFVTALMIITTPPLSRGYAFQRSVASEGLRVFLEETPDDRASLHVRVVDAVGGKPVVPWDVIVSLENPGLDIGPIVAKTEQRASNVYAFEEKELSPAGGWNIGVTVRQRQGYDANASFSIDMPRELENGRAAAERRVYGGFDAVCAFMAVLFGLLGFAQYRLASRSRQDTGDEAELASLWTPVPPALAAAVIVPLVLFSARVIAFEGPFQKQCQADGNYWTDSVPLRAGVVTSPLAVNGCATGMGAGAYHFADEAEYRYYARPASPSVALTSDPLNIETGKPATLNIRVTDGGLPATDLVVEHERLLHVVIVSRDLSVFAHVHAEDDGPITAAMRESGVFPVHYTFPKAGRYLVAVDYVIRTTHGSAQFLVDSKGGPDMGAVVLAPGRERALEGGTTVKLSTSPGTVWAGRVTRLRFAVSKDGKPSKDLEPYLGAAMHVAIIRRGFGWPSAAVGDPAPWYERILAEPAEAHIIGQMGAGAGSGPSGGGTADYMHAHGAPSQPWYLQVLTGAAWASTASHLHASLPATFGPAVDAYVIFPSMGSYAVFAQFEQGGAVRVAPFIIEVRDPSSL